MSALLLHLRAFRAQRSIDRTWLTSGAVLLLTLTIAPAQAGATVEFTLASLAHTAPYLLLSIAVAAWTRASGADHLIARAFTGHPVRMILAAAAVGALSPFCSCGVIPLIAALLGMGVPLGPVMAFWLASPVIDPSMFVLTSGLLGTEFALAKTVAAAVIGIAGGFVTMALVRRGALAQPLRERIACNRCTTGQIDQSGPVAWAFWRESGRSERFRREALETTAFLGKWLTLAFLLESLMLAWVPAEWVAGALGGNGWLPIVSATAVGVPAYLNGYAALPVVSGLIEQGMAPGAGLAFLVAGGITSVPAAMAVFALVRLRVFALYVAFALAGSLAAGIAYQQWVLFAG